MTRAIQKQEEFFLSMISKTIEEINDMSDSGIFNNIIAGYAAIAMKEAGFSNEEIGRLYFRNIFDTYSASEARKCAMWL